MRRLLIATILALSLPGCSPTQEPSPPETAEIVLSGRMAAPPDPGFARARVPREFEFPIDHGPHPDFATEWWYFTGNLATDTGRRFGYQLTLFRVGLAPGRPAEDSNWRANQLYMGHLAISDIARDRHHGRERFSRAAAGLAGAEVPPLRVWLGPWSIRSETQGLFPLQLTAIEDDIGIDLRVDAGTKPLVLQGERGLSRKSGQPGNASYYYSFTRLPTRGELMIDGEPFPVGGDSWFDREWSSSALAPDQVGWDWFALQLDDGRDLMFYRLRNSAGEADSFSQGVLVGPGGKTTRLSIDEVSLTPLRYWRSPKGTRYPVEWRLEVPQEDIELRVTAAFDAQEMTMTVRYWEGAVEVNGSHRGRGYLEMSGYADD